MGVGGCQHKRQPRRWRTVPEKKMTNFSLVVICWVFFLNLFASQLRSQGGRTEVS